MRHNKPPSEAVLTRAVELRAAGNSWEVVAKAVNRSAETVRKWPTMYPERWPKTLRDAERRLAAEAGGESLLILRQLLRSEDDKIRWHAAKALIYLHLEQEKLNLKIAAQPSSAETASEAQRLVALLESHTDEQLAQMAADECGPIASVLPLHPGHPADGKR